MCASFQPARVFRSSPLFGVTGHEGVESRNQLILNTSQPVPGPATLLLGAGLAGVGAKVRRAASEGSSAMIASLIMICSSAYSQYLRCPDRIVGELWSEIHRRNSQIAHLVNKTIASKKLLDFLFWPRIMCAAIPGQRLNSFEPLLPLAYSLQSSLF